MIISNWQYLSGFSHKTLPNAFIKAMERHAQENKIATISTPLKIFECFCDIVGIKFTYQSLSRKKMLIRTLQGFAGAVEADNFAEGAQNSKRKWVIRFIKVLASFREEVPGMPDVLQVLKDPEKCKSVWDEMSGTNLENLDQTSVRYWSSWPIKTLTGKMSYLQLSELWHSHGQAFTDQVYQGWRKHVSKSARSNTTEINRFCAFLVKNADKWPVETFRNPLAIKQLFLTYRKEFVILGTDVKKRSLFIIWNLFISHINKIFIGPGVWARPFSPLPRLTERDTTGAKAKIKVNEHGIEIQDQLLTEVPLYVTDNEAIELIFRKVNHDISVVRNWALAQAKDLYERACRRKELAAIGQPWMPGQRRQAPNTPRHFENQCATFECYGLPASDSEYKKQYGDTCARTTLAFDFGIPTSGTLYSYQCLLVSEHPKITKNFLAKFELYNTRGVLSGFLPTDKGHQLIGYKDRRGPKLSEMKIDLTTDSARWVEQVIEITQPLRDKLRMDNDDRWRYLFLTTGDAFSNPKESSTPWTPSGLKNHEKLRTRLEQQFAPHTNLRGKELIEFITRATLARLRASCGVAVYLETRDVKQMAKALGHAKYSAGLLSHYLPESLLAFFQSRWVRIFQRGMIVLAMEGSPYLLQATSFASMEELHTFLKNHAIKDIPAHLEDPEGTDNVRPISPEGVTEIHIGVGAGSLTALLSLELAVKQAERPNEVNGKAKYWARFASVITAEIERDNDGMLHEHLAVAKQHCNASRMEKLIYDAA